MTDSSRTKAVRARWPAAAYARHIRHAAWMPVAHGRRSLGLVVLLVRGDRHLTGPIYSLLLAAVAPDLDRFQDDVGNRTITSAGLHPADLVDDAGAVDDFAEDGVLVVEPRRCGRRDEKLRAVRSRACVGHRQQVRPVEREVRVELVAELITWPAGAGPQRVATLDHEVGYDPMEVGTIVEPLLAELTRHRVRPLPAALGQLDEVAHGLWRVIRKEPDDDGSPASPQRRGQRIGHNRILPRTYRCSGHPHWSGGLMRVAEGD